MPAYCILDVEVRDAETYAMYRSQAGPTVEAAGGRYLVRGGAFAVVEPGWDWHRVVVLEFPSVDAALRWYRSPEYQAVLPLRLRSTRSRMLVVEGLPAGAPPPS